MNVSSKLSHVLYVGGLISGWNKALRNYNGGILFSPYVYRGQESDVAPPRS